MTDEQLRAMARRVRHKYAEVLVVVDLELAAKLMKDGDDFDAALDAAAVAILREEMAKHKCVHQLAKEFAESCRHPLENDDPTKSFVATT